jgi:hypothetical protein
VKSDDWLPVSAAALVTGAMALLLASVLTRSGSDAATTYAIAQEQSGRWLGGAIAYFGASVGLILGLPTIVVLLQGRGRRTGLAACVVLAIGYLGTAGYAALLIFFRALVVTDGVTVADVEAVNDERGLLGFVVAWIGAFYIGELLLAIALLRAGADVCPRWIPVLLLLHVASIAASGGPDWVSKAAVLLVALPLCGLGIRVMQR